MTLKLEGDLDVLKMHSKLRARVKKSKVKVKAPNYFERYRNRYSDEAPAVFDEWFLSCTHTAFSLP